jgi:hypothetical protein
VGTRGTVQAFSMRPRRFEDRHAHLHVFFAGGLTHEFVMFNRLWMGKRTVFRDSFVLGLR